ncbi:MFS transporter [Gluconacetobacter liquefaciens]|uniref:MFS transporter n=2 Tax=Gluconacetobacter liquefaciens TaxID=89584 RepID=A0A7W4P9Q8_GLULI|nr:MFS transporter [Gluconacetobacter liquefaciens]GBR11551.1 major facilitator superfamily transporter [Gluconacetobacter liquefaciens NRIC 0522]GEB37006.1 MFS transporter [Gluconacetobacter liquefaciens]
MEAFDDTLHILGVQASGMSGTRPEGNLGKRGWSPVVILLLGVAGMLDFIDRFVFSTANDAIKHDLHLSDATVGLLGGTAFALLYGVMILPFALISDRGFAARMASFGIALWSVATALMGRTHGIASMAAARVCVGLGQAAFSPSSAALNAAYSTAEKRSTSFSIAYGISYLGYIIGLAGGGWLVEHVGWRMTFTAVGLAGIPVAILMVLFVREPRLPHVARNAESWRALLANRPLRDLLLYGVTSQVVTYGVTLWGVSFYMRSFGLSSGQAGAWFGIGIGIASVVGTFLGGPIADRVASRFGFRGAMRFAFWAYLIAQPFQVIQVLTHSLDLSLTMLVLTSTLSALCTGPIYGAIPSVVPAHRRAAAVGMYALLANAIGIGLGPPLFGWISDMLTPHFGADALRMSLLVAAILSFWPAVHLFLLQRRFGK